MDSEQYNGMLHGFTGFAVVCNTDDDTSNASSSTDFVGSDEILKSVFEALDGNVFNGKLDGTKLEWCDKLKSRAAVSYQHSTYTTRQTYIRFSKAWLENRTRKQFLEIVLYEMLDLFLSLNAKKKDDNLTVYLMECAFRYLNQCFGTQLKVNYNYLKKAGDVSDVKRILNEVSIERKRANKKFRFEIIRGPTTDFKIMTKKLFGKSNRFKCTQNCQLCYCEPQMIFRHRICDLGVKIFAIYGYSDVTVKCILCEKEMQKCRLDAHLENDCHVLNPPARYFAL